ncbi:tripeptidyl peptidase A [Ephemerocybe angulata]|uniref:tripeptidyl-peptidase II n=1 Tax=Ephemerocybe angulata TaxID=980116 RepID=A0A8H6MAI3_9AGAR|nr:tripeptidyl peptidase A [Tulosesus angulatus]
MIAAYRKLFALYPPRWSTPGPSPALAPAPLTADFERSRNPSVQAPSGWTLVGEPPAEHIISLRIGLPQSNFETLKEHLLQISDPDHERYGQHLSKEEVEEFVKPPSHSLDKAHGFAEVDLERSPAKDWVNIKVPVKLAEEMLGTSGDTLSPSSLHAHIDVIQPTTICFPRFNPLSTTFHWPDAGHSTITIKCLQQLYNTGGYSPSGYLEQFANLNDLKLFYQDQVPQAVNSSYEFVSVKGGLNNQTTNSAGAEANLDVQFAFGLTFPTPATFWSTAGRPPFLPDLTTPSNTNDFVLAQEKVPYVISTSYGEPEQTVPEAYARRVCDSLAQLGARGVSLLFSSGDGGVGDGSSSASHRCKTNDGRNATRFLPTFPAGCPYVTAVGGTTEVPEVSVDFSGGGFSDYFPRPAYQDDSVNAFLKTVPSGLYKDLYNPAGRGFPDVAAQGTSFRIFYRGRSASIGGTSASSPAFAGIVTLLNDARLAQGKSPLGFLNPAIYAKGYAGLNDITGGYSNVGCGTKGFNVSSYGKPTFCRHFRDIY